MTGTGKTSTIVEMLLQLSRRTSVLLCAPTNIAVAEVATRLLTRLEQVKPSLGLIPCTACKQCHSQWCCISSELKCFMPVALSDSQV
eukprot:scaffold229454_cov19-Tisochrysis_lutea.AAC.1